MLIRIPCFLRTSMKADKLNWLPWSELKMAGILKGRSPLPQPPHRTGHPLYSTPYTKKLTAVEIQNCHQVHMAAFEPDVCDITWTTPGWAARSVCPEINTVISDAQVSLSLFFCLFRWPSIPSGASVSESAYSFLASCNTSENTLPFCGSRRTDTRIKLSWSAWVV